VMAIGSLVVSITEGEHLMPYEAITWALVIATALWAAWIAWNWYRNTRDGRAREITSRNASRWSYALRIGLAIGVLVSVLGHAMGGVSSPAALLGDPGTASASVALLGASAAMLTARRRAWRLTGAGIAALAVIGIAAGMFGDRWVTSPSGIAWSTGRLTPVVSVPVGGDVYNATLSPAGTRYLTQRYVGDGDDEESKYGVQMVTGSVSPGRPTHTFTALDAVLPNEREALVLARVADSLEVRLERHDADSASRVAWRRTLPSLAGAQLRLDAKRTRWLVHGRRIDEEGHHLATISGAVDGTDVRQVEVPMDTLRGQVLFSYDDGAALVLGASPRLGTNFAGRSLVATYLAALRGTAITWTLWRFDRDGSRVVTSVHGYPTCAASADDAAICVEQGMRSTRLWRVERNAAVDLGNLALRYDRATASDGGTVVASSYRGHAIAVVDAIRRRGVRTALPTSDYSYVREIRASDSTVVALLSSDKGMKLVVYRLQ